MRGEFPINNPTQVKPKKTRRVTWKEMEEAIRMENDEMKQK